jgi:hypothetical protein
MKYLYGVIEAGQKTFPEIAGIEGGEERVHTISYRELAMVVSNTPKAFYDPVRDKAMAHQEVISRVMQEHDVIPMSFGTTLKNEASVRDFLAGLYDKLKNTMARIKGKIELGLKVSWQKDIFAAEIEALNPEISRLKNEMAAKGAIDYHETIRLGELVKQASETGANDYLGLIYEPLRALAASARLNNTIGPRMIMNAAFLVEKEKEAAFDRKVNDICEPYLDKLAFKYTGPWPPYNFVDIKLGKA